MLKVSVFLGLVVFFFSCSDLENKSNVLDKSSPETVEEGSVIVLPDTVIQVGDVELDTAENQGLAHVSAVYFEDGIIFTEATVLSVGEELIMPADYLTTSMHVATDNGDTLVFLNVSEDEVIAGQRISLYYTMEKGEDALVCLDCASYAKSIMLIDVTAIVGAVNFMSLKLIECTPDDYLVLNATFKMIDKGGNQLAYKTLDYKMINDTSKMYEGYYSYGIVSQYYPVLETFE